MGQLPWHAPPRGQPRTRTERLCCAAAPLGGRTQLWVACALGQPAARPRRTAGCLNRASRLRRHSVWCSGTAQSNANPCRLTMKTRLKQALSVHLRGVLTRLQGVQEAVTAAQHLGDIVVEVEEELIGGVLLLLPAEP